VPDERASLGVGDDDGKVDLLDDVLEDLPLAFILNLENHLSNKTRKETRRRRRLCLHATDHVVGVEKYPKNQHSHRDKHVGLEPEAYIATVIGELI
jgi:hypothetical protein